MSRRVGIGLIFGLLLVAVLLALASGRLDREDPFYHGRRLSQWFAQYAMAAPVGFLSSQEFASPQCREAAAAMRALGTNALPWLVRQAFDFEPRGAWGTNRIVWTAENRPLPVFGHALGLKLRLPRLVPRFELCQKATDAVWELHPPADVLLSFLRDALQAKGTIRRNAALYLLGGAGDGAERVVPYLVSALRETNNVVTASMSLYSLERIGPAGKAAIPALVEFLTNAPPWTLWRVTLLLGNFGPAAAAAVPELERLMYSANQPSMRALAAVALCQIRGEHAEALALIRRALLKARDGESGISRETMLSALTRVREFGNPLGHALAPILTELAEREQGAYLQRMSFSSSTMVLNRLDLEAATALWRRWMRNDPRAGVRAWSASKLLQLQRTNEEAVAVLCEMIRTNLVRQPYSIIPVSYLGEASSQSKLAIQTLERVAATHQHPAARAAAQGALEKIRGREAFSTPADAP